MLSGGMRLSLCPVCLSIAAVIALYEAVWSGEATKLIALVCEEEGACPNSFVTEVRCIAERELMHCELREMISLRDRVGWNRTQDFE